ncbi:MAG: hypothetical protein COW58_14430 [Thalassolituus sp. CG17_big_fil_post_rev_8_21_14_2_50_53_8]|nr:MAG: hypothetical protein COW58_14430 [Thalassolituus sp. CG17_big_fil_post_rev_8_21_14_2_50_53_8]
MGIMDALKDWWVPLITIVNFIAVWVAWSFRKATVSPDDFKGFTTEIAGSIEKLENDLKGQKSAQDKILAEQDRRLVKVEAELKHLPRHKDFEDIHVRIGGISRSLSKVEGAMNTMNQQSSLIYQHLLDQSKSRG